MLIGAALFARRTEPRVTLAAFAGGLAPDVAMFVLVLWSVRIAGIPEHQVFGKLYFSDAW